MNTAVENEGAMNAEPKQVVPLRDNGALVESVIAKGDLSKLTPGERTQYYMEVCRSVGINPLTKPLEYITLNGRLVLYALRGATDQLRAIHEVSVVDMAEDMRDGVYIVTVKVQNARGRTDMAKGAVTLGSLKGDALANAIMKAETKAKRRATLSICGLAMLDETEVDAIAPARVVQNGTGELISEAQEAALRSMIMEVDADLPRFLKYLKVTSLGDLAAERYKDAVDALEAKRDSA